MKSRGSLLGTKIIIYLYKLLGYRVSKFFIYFVAFYYSITTPKEKKYIQKVYEKVGKKFNFIVYFNHIFNFSLNFFDRFVSKISIDEFKIEKENLDSYLKLKSKRAIILLSHIGSWANIIPIFSTIMDYKTTMNIVMRENLMDNLKNIENSLTNTMSRVKVLDLKDGMQVSLDIANALINNEHVAMMSDRNINQKSVYRVNFLGEEAKINKNPFLIAYTTKSPILLMFVLRVGDRDYKVIFSDEINMDYSNKKDIEVDKAIKTYIQVLEKITIKYTDQWYNFYDFWEK